MENEQGKRKISRRPYANRQNRPPNPRLRSKAGKIPKPRRKAALTSPPPQTDGILSKAKAGCLAVWGKVKAVSLAAWAKFKATCLSTTQGQNYVIAALLVAGLFIVSFSYAAVTREKVPEAIMPVSLTVSDLSSFTDDGVFELDGLGSLTEEEIKAGLTFNPRVKFDVLKLEGGRALIKLFSYRNIVYTAQLALPKQEGEKPTTLTFSLNGPSLTVRRDTSTIYEYSPVNLTFSEQVDIRSLERNLSIMPKIPLMLSYDLNRVTITPDYVNEEGEQGWITSNSYRITIGSGYTSATGKQFADVQTLSFNIQDSRHVPRSIGTVSFSSAGSYLVDEDSSLTMAFEGNYLRQSVPVLVDTYRVSTLEKYKEQSRIYLDYNVKLDGLEKLDTNVFLIKDGENRFSIPNQGEGAYILSATYTDPFAGTERQVRSSYLVTPVSAYMQTSERETTIWLNSSKQDTPLSGYEVTFTGKDTPAGVTDNNGILIVANEEIPFDQDNWRAAVPFSVNDSDGKLVYYDNANLYVSHRHEERYYSYLFLDRALYKPEDTVCFWGFVKDFRYNTRPLPETVAVTLDPGGLNVTVDAKIDADGTYSGEIPLERIKSTQYAITAELFYPAEKPEDRDAHHTIETEYISVKEFEKPDYVISSETDRDYYASGDTVTVTVSAAFYDGTPLTNYPIETGYYDAKRNDWVFLPEIKTDGAGQATFSFPAAPGGERIYTWSGLSSNRYLAQIANDGEHITHIKNYSYFPSNILLETAFEQQDSGNVRLTARTYAFDSASPGLAALMEELKINGGYWKLYDDKELLRVAKGAPVDTTLNLDLRWAYTDTTRIFRRTIDDYASDGYVSYQNSYSLDLADEKPEFKVIDDWETKIKRIWVETKDGVAVIDDVIYKKPDTFIDFNEHVTIGARINYEDDKENYYTGEIYYSNKYDYDYWNRDYYENEEERVVEGYSFAVTNLTTGDDLTPPVYYYRDIALPAGQTARFSLLLDGKPVETTNGRMLYTIIQDGLYEYRAINQNSFDLRYEMAYGRNIRMVAAYFDGEKTHYIKQLDLAPTDESISVNIEVTPDKDSYRPGDAVNLSVRATDYTGRGVEGNLCVAVVDEAIFALAEQEVDALYGLYNNMYVNNSVWQYCTTYRDVQEEGGGWDGGKGGDNGAEFYDSYRSNFKDTALFLPTRTDANGNSRISFTLPDNTTSWRITAVEIGKDLRAGNSKSNIISSLPFFIRPVLTSKYIEGDEIAMLAQGFGTLLEKDAEIAYTVTITGDGVSTELKGSQKAGSPLEFNFGKLPVGSYTVVSRAQYLGYSDTVELPLHVLKSNLELVVSKSVDIRQKLDINAMRYPVTLTVYDKENEAFFASINSLFGHYCMQANQRMSRFVAKRVVRQTVVNGQVPYYIADGNDRASDMQNFDGGIAFYPGEPSEVPVTTYVLLVAKDQFNLPLMASYYKNQLSILTDKKLRAACYLGLAAIGDLEAADVLAELEKPDMPKDAEAYLIAAMAYLGENSQALQLYNQRLAPNVAGIKPDVRQDAVYEQNAAAIWVAASSIRHPDADKLSLYFGGTNWRYSTLFECMIYVTNYDKRVTPASFSYTVKGETRRVDMGYVGMHTMTLSRSELESLSFAGISDSLRATAYYVGEPSEFGLIQSDKMSVTKSIAPLDDSTYEVSLSIKFKKDAPTGSYDVSDWVPSNTRLYSYNKTYGSGPSLGHFATESEGQKLYVSFERKKHEERTIVYRYRVRRTFGATAALDTTYMINGDSGENCNTEKSEFTPKATEDSIAVIKAG